MSDKQQLRQRREALAQAVNSHDKEAVLSFIHPTFVGKTKRGWTCAGYQDVVRMMEHLFAPGIDYQETVAIEEIEVSGDSARLVVRRVARVGSRSQEDRAQETWRLIDGRWLLVEERQRGGSMKTRHLLVAVVVVVAVGACVAWSVFTGNMQEFMTEWGSFIGLFGGILGSWFGNYGNIKHANGPKERTFVLNAGLWSVVFLAVFFGLIFGLGHALPHSYKFWSFLVFLLIPLVLVIGIPIWNRRQAQIRAEESQESRGRPGHRRGARAGHVGE